MTSIIGLDEAAAARSDISTEPVDCVDKELQNINKLLKDTEAWLLSVSVSGESARAG